MVMCLIRVPFITPYWLSLGLLMSTWSPTVTGNGYQPYSYSPSSSPPSGGYGSAGYQQDEGYQPSYANKYSKKVQSLVAAASLSGNYDSYKDKDQPYGYGMASPGYSPSGYCETHNANCVTRSDIKCEGDHIHVQLEFERHFNGYIYVWSKYGECMLYQPSASSYYGKGQKMVTFKLDHQTCPDYGGYVEVADNYQNNGYSDPYNKGSSYSDEKKYPMVYKGRNFHIVIQFDPEVVTHDDVSFVARCDREYEGPRKAFFSYTVLDQYPVLIAGVQARSKLSVEVKKGPSAYGPDLKGLVNLGDLLTLVLKLKGYSRDYDMKVVQCWAVQGSPLSEKYKKAYDQHKSEYKQSRSIALISNDCSLKPKLIANFERVGPQGGYLPENDDYQGHTLVKAVTVKAFRFPKSDNVVIKCKVDVCYGSCGEYGYCKPVKLGGGKYNKFFHGKTIVKPIDDYGPPRGRPVRFGSSDDKYGYGQYQQKDDYGSDMDSYQPPTPYGGGGYGQYTHKQTPPFEYIDRYLAPPYGYPDAYIYRRDYRPYVHQDGPYHNTPTRGAPSPARYRRSALPHFSQPRKSIPPSPFVMPSSTQVLSRQFSKMLTQVDTFIIDHDFSLDLSKEPPSTKANSADSRFRRSPERIQSLKIDADTTAWAECGGGGESSPSAVRIWVDAPGGGFNGTISVRGAMTVTTGVPGSKPVENFGDFLEVEEQKTNHNCSVEDSFHSGEHVVEISLNAEHCHGQSLFIAKFVANNPSAVKGILTEKELVVDCYEEELVTADDAVVVGESEKLDDGGEDAAMAHDDDIDGDANAEAETHRRRPENDEDKV